MSTKGSVFQKGGGGTNYEQQVQCAFLTTLMMGGHVPCFPNAKIKEVAFQTTSQGYQTDDLLVVAQSGSQQHRLLGQIKYNLTFSDSDSNTVFKEVIEAFWQDFNNTTKFDKTHDRLVIIKSSLNDKEKNHIKPLMDWAKTHSSEADFLQEIERIKQKRDNLDMFRGLLKQANNDTDLTDKELWEFFKCLDLLAYDFLQAASTDEVHFLNLIKLSKNTVSMSSAKEIWDGILALVAQYNLTGGNFTIVSVRQQDIFKKNFDLSKTSEAFQSLQKLKGDGQLILKTFKNTIYKDFHVERESLQDDIANSLSKNSLTIITGKPGVGKSAIIKDVLQRKYPNATILVFRSDEFNQPHLSKVLADHQIQYSIQNILACVALLPEKIILIDSLEKLLEGNPDNAFKQLLSLLSEYPDIKVVATSRKYAIDLVSQKFGLDSISTGKIEVPELSDNQLDELKINFPQLGPIFGNGKIKALLKSPKYIDFALPSIGQTTEDLSNISITDFKQKLWNHIVRDNVTRKNGLPQKRDAAFLNVTIKRAKKMTLFVEPDDGYEAGVEALEQDQVIFQQLDNYKFSPSHDILEDWALIKYVEKIYDDYPLQSEEFFKRLGSEPAIRRAFRLWVEDNLVDNYQKVIQLFEQSLNNEDIDKYWIDELLIAIFKSNDCGDFFDTFKDKLLEDEAKFFNRCIHLMRMACKEDGALPIGDGWNKLIIFIAQNLQQLKPYRLSIFNILKDWLYTRQEISYRSDILAAKDIVLSFIDQVESGDKFWFPELRYRLIPMLFCLTKVAKDEVEKLINKSVTSKDNVFDKGQEDFYERVLTICTSGVEYSYKVVKELPNLVIDFMWKDWSLDNSDKVSNNDDPYEFTSRKSTLYNNDECWGLKHSFNYTPSGIYKTPIYSLLKYHFKLGVKFVCEFINYMVDSYVEGDFDYKKEFELLGIELNDGAFTKQWASTELWSAFRGLGNTNDLLVSILMSCEKYLLDIARKNTDSSKQKLVWAFNYLLKNSNNVTTAGMLSSIAMAYPQEVGETMLPLLRVRQFYDWDLQRRLQDNMPLAFYDEAIPFAQKEKIRLNKLPHRTKYRRGLRDFIIDYQFNVGQLNLEIHSILDDLNKEADEEDWVWKKALAEMDARTYRVSDQQEEKNKIVIAPTYDENVTGNMESGKEHLEIQETTLSFQYQLNEAYEGKQIVTFETWQSYYDFYYNKKDGDDRLFDRPITLAVLGLRDFYDQLSVNQKKWCIQFLLDANKDFLSSLMYPDINLRPSLVLLEKDRAIQSLHLLYDKLEDATEKKEMVILIIKILYTGSLERQANNTFKYLRNTFFRLFPAEAKNIWYCLIKYAAFKKNNNEYFDIYNKQAVEKQEKKEREFLSNLLENQKKQIDFEGINFETYECYLLLRAFVITPYYVEDDQYEGFLIKVLQLVIDDFYKDEYVSFGSPGGKQVHGESLINICYFLADTILFANPRLSKKLLEFILNSIFEEQNPLEGRLGLRDKFELAFKETILQLYEWTVDDGGKLDTDVVANFWNVWQYFFQRVEANKIKYFSSFLLLDLGWDEKLQDWQVLRENKGFYKEMVLALGKYNVAAIIGVFLTIGQKTFLPEGISILKKVLSECKLDEVVVIVSDKGEQFIKQLFHNHIAQIKNDRKLLNDYLWILNQMVDLGSSTAYLIRENVITYKSVG